MGKLLRYPGRDAAGLGAVDAAALELLEAARANALDEPGDSFADQQLAAFIMAATRLSACMPVENTPTAIAEADADQALALAEMARRPVRRAEDGRRAALLAQVLIQFAHATLPHDAAPPARPSGDAA